MISFVLIRIEYLPRLEVLTCKKYVSALKQKTFDEFLPMIKSNVSEDIRILLKIWNQIENVSRFFCVCVRAREKGELVK